MARVPPVQHTIKPSATAHHCLMCFGTYQQARWPSSPLLSQRFACRCNSCVCPSFNPSSPTHNQTKCHSPPLFDVFWNIPAGSMAFLSPLVATFRLSLQQLRLPQLSWLQSPRCPPQSRQSTRCSMILDDLPSRCGYPSTSSESRLPGPFPRHLQMTLSRSSTSFALGS